MDLSSILGGKNETLSNAFSPRPIGAAGLAKILELCLLPLATHADRQHLVNRPVRPFAHRGRS